MALEPHRVGELNTPKGVYGEQIPFLPGSIGHPPCQLLGLRGRLHLPEGIDADLVWPELVADEDQIFGRETGWDVFGKMRQK